MLLLLTISNSEQSAHTPANHDKTEMGDCSVLKDESDNISEMCSHINNPWYRSIS